MDWGTVIQLALAIVGAALIVGGIIAYRGSTRTGVRALSSSSIAAGVVMWVVVLITVSVFVTGDAPLDSPDLHGSSLPSLKFDDVNYVYSASAELPSGEVAVFVINGTEISMDDMGAPGLPTKETRQAY